MVLWLTQTCLIIKDQGRQLGLTQMKNKVSLLKLWKTSRGESKCMIVMERNVIVGSF